MNALFYDVLARLWVCVFICLFACTLASPKAAFYFLRLFRLLFFWFFTPGSVPDQLEGCKTMILRFSRQGPTVVSTVVADELVPRSHRQTVRSFDATASRRRVRRGKQQRAPQDTIHPESPGLSEASLYIIGFYTI